MNSGIDVDAASLLIFDNYHAQLKYLLNIFLIKNNIISQLDVLNKKIPHFWPKIKRKCTNTVLLNSLSELIY
jgi:hypothetical protein